MHHCGTLVLYSLSAAAAAIFYNVKNCFFSIHIISWMTNMIVAYLYPPSVGVRLQVPISFHAVIVEIWFCIHFHLQQRQSSTMLRIVSSAFTLFLGWPIWWVGCSIPVSPIRRCKVSSTHLFPCRHCGNLVLYSLSAAAAFPLQKPQTKCMFQYSSLVNIFDTTTTPLELVGISQKQEEMETLNNWLQNLATK